MGSKRNIDDKPRGRKRRLYLLRHAKAVLGGEGIDDQPRKLAERGHQQMAALTQALEGKKFAPDLVLVSPSQRTLETLDLLRPRLGAARIATRDELYLASAAELLRALREIDGGVRSALLIGHNPGLHELALSLIAAAQSKEKPKQFGRVSRGFPTGALAELGFFGPWTRLDAGFCEFRRFLRPKDLLSAAAS